ncbi:phage tail tape measure protein [Pararhizobium sp. O133]|uniref:phage tail tape measure protein n=1 Tax=Pararhizobium sp. O133 TaxID=3449278 RepID=UPI003F687285
MDQVNRRADALNRRQSFLARNSAAMFTSMLRYAAPAAAAYAAKAALVDFAAVERQMTRIGITADASADDIKAAFEGVQQIAKDLSFGDFQPAISALDTLVSSGLSLKEAMAFLPSILATTQATGAQAEDIANTAIKASSALKLEAKEMQRAFDEMVAGGKAGQFEMKDMASFIPELANSFASLGYSGHDGLKELIAILQTLREDTGSAEAAATQAQNIFGKMFSGDTAAKFKKFGIDLRKEMTAAKAAGEDAVSAFVRLSQEAIKGDLTKLPLLFTDQEFRLGMQSLMTSGDSYRKFIEAVNSTKVDGTVLRDVGTVLTDTQASIDRMSASWEKLKTSFGGAIAKPAGSAMDGMSKDLDRGSAIRNSLEKKGMGYWAREWWMAKNMPLGAYSKSEEADRLAAEGGYKDPEWRKKHFQGPMPGKVPEFPGRKLQGIPSARPGQSAARRQSVFPGKDADDVAQTPRKSPDQWLGSIMPSLKIPSAQEWKDALKMDAGISGLKRSGEDAGQSVANGGRQAKESIKESAAFFEVAGVNVGASIMSAAEKLSAAARTLNSSIAASVTGGKKANADTGRSMPDSAGKPATGGGGGY